MASKTYAECVAELPIENVPGLLEYQKTEHSIRLRFETNDGYLKPAIFTSLDDLSRLTDMSYRVQVTHEIREIRYQRRKFELAK